MTTFLCQIKSNFSSFFLKTYIRHLSDIKKAEKFKNAKSLALETKGGWTSSRKWNKKEGNTMKTRPNVNRTLTLLGGYLGNVEA